MKLHKLTLFSFISLSLLAHSAVFSAHKEESTNQQVLRLAKGTTQLGIFAGCIWAGHKVITTSQKKLKDRFIDQDDKHAEVGLAAIITPYLTYLAYRSLKTGLKNFNIWPSKAQQ